MLRRIRNGPIIGYASPGRLRLISGLVSRRKVRGKWARRWRNKGFSWIPEMIRLSSLSCTLMRKCGKNGGMRLHFLYKDWPEDGLQGRGLMLWRKRNKINLIQSSRWKKRREKVRRLGIKRRFRGEETRRLRKILRFCIMNLSYGEFQNWRKFGQINPWLSNNANVP